MAETTADLPLLFKSIADLLDYRFLVEDYQRGFKWTADEVKDLLDDIEEFGRKQPQADHPASFYCLQPIVVRQHLGELSYELIDGQQRITTLYLVLAYLRIEGWLKGEIFQIDYRTREGSADFLRKINACDIMRDSDWEQFMELGGCADNIDNFYFFEAYKAIVGWFGAHKSLQADFCDNLLHRCRVIWYETKPGTKPKEVFIRLNSGKIPLTNAELIKALFLGEHALQKSDAPPEPITGQYRQDERQEDQGEAQMAPAHRRHEVAQQWDQIEYALQGEAFWGFINRKTEKNSPPTHIDFLFNLVSGKKPEHDSKHAFRYYAARAKKPGFRVGEEWGEIRSRFQCLREWYEDTELYHLTGFVITRGLLTIKDLLADARTQPKSEFVASVKGAISGKIGSYKALSELQYGDVADNIQLLDILLLFNLQTIIGSRAATRFPFDRYKQVTWSLEHIHAQNARDQSDRAEFERWHDYYLRQLAKIGGTPASELRQEVEAWFKGVPEGTKPLTGEEAQALLATRKILEPKLDRLLTDAGNLKPLTWEELHGIGNLALLDRDANSSLNNEYFPIKRERVIAMERAGKFIPTATKNVFLKYYSRDAALQIDHWGPSDCESYADAIADALKDYGVKTSVHP